MKSFIVKYFSDSYKQLVSFLAREEDLTLKEIEELKVLLDKEISKPKEKK